MKENKYDEAAFFEKYSSMLRSKSGLNGAGEWESLKNLIPSLHGLRVLDLGCGYGWHSQYAAENGAARIVGVDISKKMLAFARENTSPAIEYIELAIEDISFPDNSFDFVLSSLALHYIENYKELCRKVYNILPRGGQFLFSAEHPIFTAEGSQRWCNSGGEKMHWPVDRYFEDGRRDAEFLGERVVKYHRSLTTYFEELVAAGFTVEHIIEPQPPEAFLSKYPEMKEELKRPMMMIISARKS